VQTYSCLDYWTACWTYPRSRLREPFPRRSRRRDVFAALLPPPSPVIPVQGAPFVLDSLNESFVLYPRSYHTPGFTTDPYVIKPGL